MPVRPLVMFPDPRLRMVAEPVRMFDASLRALAADLLDTLRAAPGIGITAPHIGVTLRLVVLELTQGEVRSYANPEVVWAAAELTQHPEGSIAMPGVTEVIARPARIELRYQDLDGEAHTEAAEGLLAVCHQHEVDQLDGIFWLQRLSRLKRDRAVKRYGKLLLAPRRDDSASVSPRSR